jgi:hypothetical protein
MAKSLMLVLGVPANFNRLNLISQSIREKISIMAFERQFELSRSDYYFGGFNFRALTFCEEFTSQSTTSLRFPFRMKDTHTVKKKRRSYERNCV